MANWIRFLFIGFLCSCSVTKLQPKLPDTTFDKQGHRGCRGLMPENTIPAMLHAIDLGVNTLEMDAVITADSQVVLSHDPFFNHDITTKPDGTFITEAAERNFNIYQMTYDEMKQFDVGLKEHPRFPKQQKLSAIKPLLTDVIDSVEAYIKQKGIAPVAYNIETKTTAKTDNRFHPEPETFVRLLMNVIEKKGLEKRVIIQSFDVRTLQIIKRQYPNIKTSLLVDAGDSATIADQLKNLGFTPTVYSPHYTLVTKELIAFCHASNIQVLPWTVNTKDGIINLKKMGVDGVITDYPDLFAAIN